MLIAEGVAGPDKGGGAGAAASAAAASQGNFFFLIYTIYKIILIRTRI